MKQRIKNSILSALFCGALATASAGVAFSMPALTAGAQGIKPTGTLAGTLSQEINDADLDTFKVYGASVRKINPTAFRFLATIEQSDLNLIPNTEETEFGLLIMPKDMLTDEEMTAENASKFPALIDTDAKEVPDGGLGYYITLTGKTLQEAFPVNLYNTVLAARAYVKYEYTTAEGKTMVDYAYSADTIYRSMAYIASKELVDMENRDYDFTGAVSPAPQLDQYVANGLTNAELTLSKTELFVGQTATATLENATDGVNPYAYNLSSSNEAVIINANGEVEAVQEGTATITARIGTNTITTEVQVKGAEEFTAGNILYSTQDGGIFMPNGLLDEEGETIVSAIGATDGVDYFDKGRWSALALKDAEIRSNAVRDTKLTVRTSNGDLYTVIAKSYAGVIDELSDFETFFKNEPVENPLYGQQGQPAKCAPNVYGYYIVVKDLGTANDELTFEYQTTDTNYNMMNGFNGVLDGAGHTLRFKLMKGGLVGLILGNNAWIKNLSVIYADETSTQYGVFGYMTSGNPVIENCYIERTNNKYAKWSVFGIMSRPNAKLVLKDTVVYGYNISNECTMNGNMWISASSTNAYLIHARTAATGWVNVTNFTKVFNDGIENGAREVALSEIADASTFNECWAKENGKLTWKGAEDMAVSKYEAKYVQKLDKTAMYSTANTEMLLPDGWLTDGDKVVDAYDENGNDYYETDWQNLALSADEINSNSVRTTVITVKTEKGYYYQFPVKSYAGVINELSDFTTFFDLAPEGGSAKDVYGYYIVTDDLGSATEELTFVNQTTATDYSKTDGFNGVLDGAGHTLRFKLMKGGLVGLILGNAVIKNLAVIYEDASFISQAEGGGYGVFGYVTNGAPEIRNCYIERTNNVASRSTVFGIMARPNAKLTLHNTVVYGYLVPNDCTWWNDCWISSASTNAYVIHGRENANAQSMAKNFTKVYYDAIENGSRDIPLADIANASGFDNNYWYKENGRLIWKGFEVVNVSWVDGDTTTKQAVTKGCVIAIPEVDGMYWSKDEAGEQIYDGSQPQRIDRDMTLYAQHLTKTLEESALYSTADKEFFLPTEIGEMENVSSIKSSENTDVVYYENGMWIRSLDLTQAQIEENAVLETPVVISTAGGRTYNLIIKSYAGVIDELSDFETFFKNEPVENPLYGQQSQPAKCAPNVYGYYIVVKDLGTANDALTFEHQTTDTNYNMMNGFNGVLDGAGHTLRFKLMKGGLVGLILGNNAWIKNLSVIYADETSTQYGVFGYMTSGNPVIENCYIERTNNEYAKWSVFGIMSRPNAKLVLKDTVVYGYNISNECAMNSNMWISASSTNAYLIHARANATAWVNVQNFTKVFNDGIENGAREVALSEIADASTFNECWAKEDGKLTWKGAADMPVKSVGEVVIESKNLAENGATQYTVVLPTGADATLTTAKDELVDLFEEATGATLTVAEDVSYDTYDAVISIGNTQAYKNAGIQPDTMNSQGYHLERKNNAIYINGGSSLGCLYGVYGLMNELFGFEQFSADCYTLNKNQTVALPDLKKTESPDIAIRMPSNGAIINGGDTFQDRFGMSMTENDFFFQVGDYTNNANEGANTGWRVWHNSLEILPVNYWTAQGKSNWFSNNKVNGKVNQLCYTAHGNADDYTAMVNQIVAIMAQTLTSSQITSRPNAKYLTLTSEDGNGVCTCSACTAAKSQYGSDVGAVIKLCNDVMEGVRAWMEQNTRFKKDVKLLFFAYNDYVTAPTAGTIDMDEDVGVMYAVSDYVNYYYDVYDTENDAFRAQFETWAALADASGSELCMWTYTKNFSAYMLRADVYGKDAFFNQNAYKYFADKGVDLWFNQGATNGTTTLSAFEKLNGYLDAQLMWNSALDVKTLTDKWFNAMYGDAADDYMKNLYDAQNAMACKVFGTTKKGIPSVAVSKSSMKYKLTNSDLQTWFGYIDSAKNAINSDGSLSDNQKAAYLERITEEWIAIEYWYVYLFYSKYADGLDGVTINVANEQAAFRAALGYNSETKTYAKDVMVLERADISLAQWIDSNFSEDLIQ